MHTFIFVILIILFLTYKLSYFQGKVLDEAAIKKMVLNFENRRLKNREMRMNFPDSPETFLESEVELHEILQEMRVLTTAPDYYPFLVKLQMIPSLLELLSHENTNIAVATVELLQEFTDVDILNESDEGAEALIDALLEHQVIALMVQNLDRLNESVKEEADGVHNTLSIMDNLTELRTDITNQAMEQGFLAWLLKRLKSIAFDANKLYASEMLSILLEDNQKNRAVLGELDGIDMLLQQLAVYVSRIPNSVEERELVENLINSLCNSLRVETNSDRFLKGEGLQLISLMLKNKNTTHYNSLKVLDYAMSGSHGKDNCNKFVDILGLGVIFPLFMKTPRRSRKRVHFTEQHEERVCSIIASMFKNCQGSQRQQLVSKFSENDHEKVNRLLDLHFKYLEKVEIIDDMIDDNHEEDAIAIYIKKLEGGLSTLQIVDYIIVEVCAAGPKNIKQCVMEILKIRGASLKTIKHILREYARNLVGKRDKEEREHEKRHILHLVNKF